MHSVQVFTLLQVLQFSVHFKTQYTPFLKLPSSSHTKQDALLLAK